MKIGPLTLGLSDPLHIRVERLRLHGDACRLLYVSDVHLRASRTEQLSRQVLAAVRSSPLNAVLLGGDLVDQESQLANLRELVREIAAIAPLYAVGGNHDHRVGLPKVRDAVVSGGGEWIHSASVRLIHGSRTIAIAGPAAATPTDGDCRVLCAHYPQVWTAARKSGYHLVLAGHLHGCQCVAFSLRGRLFPGAMFYRCCVSSRREQSSCLVVSRGVSDLVPIRWRCPREVVLCHV